MPRVERNTSSKNKKYHIAIVGLENSGKTSLLSYIKNGEIGRVYPTFGINYENLEFKDLSLVFYDLSGKEEYRPYWSSILKKSDLVIYVIDGLDLTNIKDNKITITKCIDSIHPNTPFLFLVNKVEHIRALRKKEIIELYELTDLTKRITDWDIIEVSALTGVGIPEVLKWIYKKLMGKELKIGISLSEIIIFDKTGNVIYNKNNLFPSGQDIKLTSGFIFAVYKFAKQTLNERPTNIVIGSYKIVLSYLDSLTGVIIVHRDDSEEKALEMLNQILSKIEQQKMSVDSLDINKFIRENIFNYIYY
ncbi:MAG: ADP-ribosylation factor-like protein [Promethearchaeota archaeon]